MLIKNIITILLVGTLLGCNSRNQKKSNDITELNTNQQLIEEFYRTEHFRPENPEFNFVKVIDFNIDLNINNLLDTILLKTIKGGGWDSDPGDFRQVIIKMDNGTTWEETNFGGWVRFDHNYQIPENIKKINELNSDFLLVTELYGTKIIGLFGWVYASKPGLMTIIDFSTSQPRLIVNKELFLTELTNQSMKVINSIDDTCSIQIIDKTLEMICN